MEKNKYMFSVIIPVYKVEEYLEETIVSVLKQTIGFKKNIQIILVNDGSPDNSEDICLKYRDLYPDNIIYVKQKNAGVSAARNNGLNYATGEFINFLDSDDKWEKDVFAKAYKMFQNNSDVDLIGVRQRYFEGWDGYPSLDHKFDKDKVVDINEDYDHIQLSVTSAFMRKSAIGDIRYDTRVKFSEDAKFIFDIIIKSQKLGIISSSLHLYRKRLSETSAIQTKNSKDDWYLITPELCYKYVFDKSIEKFGKVIRYAQYYVMYDYQYRFKEQIPDCISDEVRKKYFKITRELFKYIDDEVILKQQRFSIIYKMKCLSFKYDRDIREELKYSDKCLYFNDNKLTNITRKSNLHIMRTIFDSNKLTLFGMFNLYALDSDYKLEAVVNGSKRYKIDLKSTNLSVKKFFNVPFNSNKGFTFTTDLKNFKSLEFYITYKDNEPVKMNFRMNADACFNTDTKLRYRYNGNIYYYNNKGIRAKKDTLVNRMWFSLRTIKHLLLHFKVKQLFVRMIYNMFKIFNNKKIWIVSDRPIVAGDNGFAFFKYLSTVDNKNIKKYFVIDKKSDDYNKVKQYGKCLKYGSFYYKLMFLLSDKIISSQADPWVTNPFENDIMYYQDLINSDFVFLQHGITKDDISNWLNCYQKNIKLFVTAAKDEYKSIIENSNYGYDKDVVKLTGFPRYDYLKNEKEKILTILPTWRLSVAGNIDSKTGMRIRHLNFKNSDYYNFYNKLINDSRLIKVMKKNGYKGFFAVHPSHLANADDFEGNDVIKVFAEVPDYNKIFKESALLVSDYSSTPFDFAYMKKPVVYSQFDREDFFKSHLYTEGYFSYEKDGFGPVLYDYDSTVNAIIKYIENDCVMEEKYKKRVDKFFCYTDNNNCKRVYDAILDMDSNDKKTK